MSTIAKISNGTLVKVGDGAGSEAFTTVPEVKTFSGITVKFDLLDVTSHDSSGYFKEWIPGLSDGDMMSVGMNWRASNTVHKNLRLDNVATTKRNFKIVFPDSSDNNALCATYVMEVPQTADVGKEMTMAMRLKITGSPTWS